MKAGEGEGGGVREKFEAVHRERGVLETAGMETRVSLRCALVRQRRKAFKLPVCFW